MNSIRSRFNQKGFITFSKVEQLIFKACGGKCFDEELNEVCNFFYNDFNRDNLAAGAAPAQPLWGGEGGANGCVGGAGLTIVKIKNTNSLPNYIAY